jgi:hypothetical protein
MFGFGKENKYESIFESEDSTYNHIYKDRSKTALILGDEEFINAWLGSPNQARVSSVIAREAERGDIPSIKQMIWLSQMMLQDMQANSRPVNIDAQTSCLKGCLHFCAVGEKFGMNYAYYMMGSFINLYQIYMSRKGIVDDAEISQTLKAAVSCANRILEEEHLANDLYDDPQGTLRDARSIVDQYGRMSQLADQLFGQ